MDPVLLGILIVVAMAVVGGLVYVGLREDNGRDPLQDRLAEYGDRETPTSLEEIELSLSIRDRVFVPMMKSLANTVTKFTPQKQLESARKKIELAGLNTDPTIFFLQRIVFLVVFGVAGALIGFVVMKEPTTTALGYTIAGATLGFQFPVISINGKIKKRQKNILKALPDALDLLVICVEAGLGFDMAMGKIYEKWDDDLALAFGRVLREIQLGKLRREALKDMSDRMDVPDVNAFTAAVIQAEQLGVSMAKILRVQADQMRTKRRQRAQEKAQQAPVKMMIPMVLLIFPSIWVVLLGPAILKVMAASGNGAF
ncbi:MAG: type II secretion system F family protein [Anaerolineae bacterium]